MACLQEACLSLLRCRTGTWRRGTSITAVHSIRWCSSSSQHVPWHNCAASQRCKLVSFWICSKIDHNGSDTVLFFWWHMCPDKVLYKIGPSATIRSTTLAPVVLWVSVSGQLGRGAPPPRGLWLYWLYCKVHRGCDKNYITFSSWLPKNTRKRIVKFIIGVVNHWTHWFGNSAMRLIKTKEEWLRVHGRTPFTDIPGFSPLRHSVDWRAQQLLISVSVSCYGIK